MIHRPHAIGATLALWFSALLAGPAVAGEASFPALPDGRLDGATDAVPLQIPIDSRLIRLTFSVADGDLLRTVVTSTTDPPKTKYAAGKEYWSANRALSVTDYGAIIVTTSPIVADERVIDAFLLPNQGWGPTLAVQQVIGKQGWTQGTYAPSAARARLFKAVDPDEPSRQIGLLIEQDQGGALTRVTWYKSTLAGTIFSKTPPSLTFRQVLDGRGRPSTDPQNIATGTWYYASGS